MKFGIALENTKNSLDFFENFFEKFKCEHKYELDLYIVQEFIEQEDDIDKLKKKIIKIIKDNSHIENYEIIVEQGEPFARVLNLITKRKIDVFVAGYEHSFLGNKFYEKVIEEINIPVLTFN